MPLSPNYIPKDNETHIYSTWQSANVGNPDHQNFYGKKNHTILMPPPNLTGNMHAGHAFGHYVMDTLSRLARQRGEQDLWFPGVDHAGLQLEGVIDKMIRSGDFDDILKEADGLKTGHVEEYNSILKEDLPKYLKTKFPEVWLKLAWSKVNLWRDNQQIQSAILGDTPDYSRSLFTLDDKNIEMVNYAFEKYWQDGLIYKGSYLVNWSVGLQTALSDVAGEIEYEKKIDPFVTFEYKLFSKTKEQSEDQTYQSLSKSILVGTVRPETIFGDYAVAVHPEVFERDYAEFRELLESNCLFVKIPLTSKMIPVLLAEEVDPKFGSGALKITPAHDTVDYNIFHKYLGGDFEQAIGRDGKLTSICGPYSGITVDQARLHVIKALVEEGFVPKKIDNTIERKDTKNYFDIDFADNINPEDYQIDWKYEHNVTLCERTKTVVEPLISEEFFISYHNKFDWKPINKDDSVSIANRHKTTNLQELGLKAVTETNFYSTEYKERGINFLNNIKDWCISRDLIWGHKMPVWYNLDSNPERKFWNYQEFVTDSDSTKHFAISQTKPNLTGNWVQEEKILDTWFSSCLWPLSTLDYPKFAQSKTHEKIQSKSQNSLAQELKVPQKSNVIFVHGGEAWENRDIYRQKMQSGELNSYWYSSFFDNAIDGSKPNWKTELANYCNLNHVSLIKPKMPNKTNADYTKWKWVFEQSLPFINSQTVLIGHSLGSMFLTKYLAENKVDCKSIFLVSGGIWTTLDGFECPENLSELMKLGNKVNIIHSDDDKIVDPKLSYELHLALPEAKLLITQGEGHFGGQSPELLELIKNEIKINPKPLDFEVFYPTQEMLTAKEIFYQWIIRMTTLSYYFTAQIPYTDLIITPTVLDEKGKKMSKSLGNGLEPVSQIEKYSSDALRMAMLGGMYPNRNMKMGGRLADELCEKYRNFGNKMWNVARFFEYQQEKHKISK